MARSNPSSNQAQEPYPTSSPTESCPVFAPGTLKRQLVVDAAIRRTIAITAVGCVLLAMTLDAGDTWFTLTLFGIIGLWFFMGTTSTRVAQQVPKIAILVEQDPAAAETQLAKIIGQKLVPRPLRLMLYHRLAMIRQRQRRYGEVAAICQAVLNEKPGGGIQSAVSAPPGTAVSAGVKPKPHRGDRQMLNHLFLLLIDAHLHCHNLMGAYVGLWQLHRCKLPLAELLELTLLQTRYEVTAGHTQTALNGIEHRVRLAELMPAPQCGAMHLLLAVAAGRARQEKLYQWLVRRGELLCEPNQLRSFQLAVPMAYQVESSPGLDTNPG